MSNLIISAAELNEKIKDHNLIILDCSPETNKAGLEPDFENTKIKGARYFDLENDFCNPDSSLPNTLPTPEQFTENCRKLGINNSSEIILYDNLGIYSSPRVWWMFKIMGHDGVAVLNGGLAAWMQLGLPTQTEHSTGTKAGNFTANLRLELISDLDFIKQNLTSKEALIIDARSPGRFDGLIPEPREGLRSGNIPGSINIPFQDVLENGKFREKDELKSIFREVKDPSKELVFSCGSGITACILFLAGELVLDHKKSVYDGSWTEWGSRVKND
ncbi:MAG: sulfurtransferase [Salinimicrobium sp.]